MAMVSESAEDLQPKAQQALRESPIGELRALRVHCRNGALQISGAVSSFYHKQLAQELVRSICRDNEIELINAIHVP